MSRKARISLFVIFSLSLLIIFTFFSGFDFPRSIPTVILFSSLIMLAFSALFIEHFFPTPSNVLASSLSILLLLAPARQEVQKFGIWYFIFFAYVFIIFVFSLSAMLLLNESYPTSALRNRISYILKRFVVFFGNGQWLFTWLFLLTLLFYVDSQSNIFIILAFYSAIVILIDPKKFTLKVIKEKLSKVNDIGEIIGVQSRNTFIARLFKEHSTVHRFDTVEFKYSMDETERILTGVIIDNYLLNEQQWIKILSSKEIREAIKTDSSDTRHEANVVYKIDQSEKSDPFSRLVGVVVENSNIGKIRFEYGSKVSVQEGDLLELKIGKETILYQVVEGVTEVEKLELRNEAGFIIGEAVQLGSWNNKRLTFDKYGWVPEINTPLFLASDIEPVKVAENEIIIGKIPGTNFPAILNIDETVTHHLGILGVTGTGKSVFVRDLIRKIINRGIKVICIDFTNEYRSRFIDLGSESIVPSKIEQDLFQKIDILSVELSKFKNNQNSTLIQDSQKFLMEKLTESINSFVNSDKNVALFELPDVENTTGILDYTRWFFKALFTQARKGEYADKRICVVLEEAHTVIPEWNFIGVEEKKAQALVNAIGQIALQGRKYNIGFIVVAQRTANVSKTVLTQCNSMIAFQQFDKTSCDFLGNYMDEQRTKALSTLKFRQAIAVGRGFRSGVPIIFEVPVINEKVQIEKTTSTPTGNVT